MITLCPWDGSTVGFLDLPDPPDEPGRPERASMSGADRPALKPRELPGPDERGRVYEAMRAHTSAETAGESSDAAEERIAPRPADRRGRAARLPGRGATLHGDVDGPRRHARRPTGRPQRIRPRTHQHRTTGTANSGSAQNGRRKRPRRSAGSVGRARTLADAQAIEQENKDTYGGWLEGFEHRLKGEDRLKEKIAERLEGEPDKSSTEILRKIPDTMRYTFCFQPENYTRGYYDIKDRFENLGYEMYYSKNWWTNPEYKGINTRWATPEGQRFEVQFHAPDSFHAKEYVTHLAYERIRDPDLR